MKKKLFLTVLMIFVLFNLTRASKKPDVNNGLLESENYFIENKGQWENEVLFLTRLHGLDIWITKQGLQYTFYELLDSTTEQSLLSKKIRKRKFENHSPGLIGQRVFVKYQNANSNQFEQGLFKRNGYFNYFIGDDESRHANNVGTFNEVIIRNIYDGIDVRYYFEAERLRYDFLVNPGYDYKQICLQIEGSNGSEIKDQDLVFSTIFGDVKQSELFVYQNISNKRMEIVSRWKQNSDYYSFEMDDYDKTKLLIIDPLIYSTYIGGNHADQSRGIDVDEDGNAYITGYTLSLNYVTTPGAFQLPSSGNYQDVFITKVNSTGSGLIYSTLLGGNNVDLSTSITVDDLGNAFVTGATLSTNFNSTSGAFQTSNTGGNNIFVTKLNPTGTALIYSCVLGGDYEDEGFDIVVDDSGNAYVTGYSSSINYHITPGVFQNSNEGFDDVFVTKLNSSGSAILYSTLIGGSDNELGYAIDLDANGNAYITGYTQSMDFDVTSGSYQTIHDGGGFDIFVTKVNTTGTALVYSTFFGGNDQDEAYSIAVGEFGNAYITGYTASLDFDTTAGVLDSNGDAWGDAFVSKFNSSGTALIYSTFIGGTGEEYGYSIAVNKYENAILTGWTTSNDFQITSDAYQNSIDGFGYDFFITKLNDSGDGLDYSTFFGGTDSEGVYALAIDTLNNAFITGETLSPDFDITVGAYQSTLSTGILFDNFVSKLCLGLPMEITLTSALNSDNQIICGKSSISTITYDCPNAMEANITNLPAGVTAVFSNNTVTISGTPSGSGVYNYTILLHGGCGSASANGTITIDKCTGMEEQNFNSLFQLFPNPNNGFFSVGFNQKGIYKMEIFDYIGKCVYQNSTTETSFNIITELSSGIYLLKITDEEKDISEFRKMVIQKN